MVFSEPVDKSAITDQTFMLLKADSTLVPVEMHWEDPFHLQFIPEKLRAGRKYTLAVTEFDILDLAGNPLGDSLISYPIATLNADSLGSVSGEVTVLIPPKEDDPIVLTLVNTESNQEFEIEPSGRVFHVSVPGGKYLLDGFIDSNGDGELSDGSLDPLELSETTGRYADTIMVRPRFETAGIVLEFK
jgi:hypothetical protein